MNSILQLAQFILGIERLITALFHNMELGHMSIVQPLSPGTFVFPRIHYGQVMWLNVASGMADGD